MTGPTLPLREIVAGLRLAYPAAVGLDEVTAADLAGLSGSCRKALAARYLAKPGQVVTLADAAKELGRSRAAVEQAEKRALASLGVTNAVGRRGPRMSTGGTTAPRRPRSKHRGDLPFLGDPAKTRVTYATIAGEEEARLIRAYQAGDRQAGAVLLEAHVGLVTMFAHRLRGRGLDAEDLLQEARIAFLRAVSGYQFDKGANLSTYANYWLREYVSRAVNDTGQTVRVPLGLARKVAVAYKKGIDTPEGLVEAGITATEERARGALQARMAVFSLDVPRYEDHEETWGDTMVGDIPTPDDVYEAVEQRERDRERLGPLLAMLDERERDVVLSRFAAPEDEEETLKEIGERWGVSRERIRQLQERALTKLREHAALGEAEDQNEKPDPEDDHDEPDRDAEEHDGTAAPTSRIAQRLQAMRLGDGRSWYAAAAPIAEEHRLPVSDLASCARRHDVARARAHFWWWLLNESGVGCSASFLARTWGFSLTTVLGQVAHHEARVEAKRRAAEPPMDRILPRPRPIDPAVAHAPAPPLDASVPAVLGIDAFCY